MAKFPRASPLYILSHCDLLLFPVASLSSGANVQPLKAVLMYGLTVRSVLTGGTEHNRYSLSDRAATCSYSQYEISKLL